MAGTEFEVENSDSTNDWKWYIYTDEERAETAFLNTIDLFAFQKPAAYNLK